MVPLIQIQTLDVSQSSQPSPETIDVAALGYIDLGSVAMFGDGDRIAIRLCIPGGVQGWGVSNPDPSSSYYNNIRVWYDANEISLNDILCGFPSTWGDRNTVALTAMPKSPTVDSGGLPLSNTGWSMAGSASATYSGLMIVQFRNGYSQYPRDRYGYAASSPTQTLRIFFDGEIPGG